MKTKQGFNMKKVALLALSVFLISTVLVAQDRIDGTTPQGENLKVPEGWELRLDKPNPEVIIGDDSETADILFINMTPGWHITTGPAAIFYHPNNTVTGNYTISTEFHLYNPEGRNREAFGVFFGGKNLDKENQQYVYFLIRNTGEYLVKTRSGAETANIQGWTATDAMHKFTEETETSAENTFAVEVSPDKVTFYLNDTELTSIPSKGVETDGLYGMRVNHSNDVHVSSLVVWQK